MAERSRRYTHAPDGCECPFCEVAVRRDRPGEGTRQADVVLSESRAMAFVASRWWPRNPGHVLVVPTRHYENLYDLPDVYGAAIHSVARRVAWAMKAAYGCEGVSTRQHNEPAGQQDVWHHHLHVLPRYAGDGLYASPGEATTAAARAPYAAALRRALAAGPGASVGEPW